MSTRADRLLARIQGDGFKPRAGDVFRRDGYSGLWYAVGVGVPSSRHNHDYIFIAHKNRHGDWTFHDTTVFDWGAEGRGSAKFRLVDTGFDGFIWGGFSPNDTGRPYVLMKEAAGVVLRAGCRRFTTYAQAARHWKSGNADGWQAKLLIAYDLFAKARRRGWLKVKRQPPKVKKVTGRTR